MGRNFMFPEHERGDTGIAQNSLNWMDVITFFKCQPGPMICDFLPG